MDQKGKAELVDDLRGYKQPLFFDRHFYFFSFVDYNLEVDFINMVRNPIERVASNFYFARNPSRWKQREVQPSESWFTKKFDKCVLSNDPECQVHLIEFEIYFVVKSQWRTKV